MRLQGSPEPLDEFLRPFVRGVQIILGAVVSGLAWWLTPVWFWPIPICFILVCGEVILWLRGDRIYRLVLTPNSVVFYRGPKFPEITLSISDLSSANLYYQKQSSNRWHVWCVLRGEDSCAAFQMELHNPPEWAKNDVPIDIVTALFGGNPALLRAMVLKERVVGQVFRDPEGAGLSWLRTQLPSKVWSQAARVWQAHEPQVDANGMHTGNPDGLMQSGPMHWNVGPQSIVVDRLVPAISSRSVPDLDNGLPLFILPLQNDLQLCFPAPALPHWCTQTGETNPQSMHTHMAEGVALFWAALNQVSVDDWSPELREVMIELDALLTLPSSLRDHMGLN